MTVPTSTPAPGLLGRLLLVGTAPDDSDEDVNRKRRLTLLVVMIIPAGIVWGLAYLGLGCEKSSLIPMSYAVLSAVSLAHFGLTKRYVFFANTQFLLILLLPNLLQWSLGGFVDGSAVMVWSILAPLGVLTSFGPRPAVGWFVAYALLCIATGFAEPWLPEPEASVSASARTAFFVMNLLVVTSLVFVVVQHFARMQLEARDESDRLLLNILPAAVVRRMKRDHSLIADEFSDVTILFADIVGFTELSSRIPPHGLVSLLNDIFSRFDQLADLHGLEKIKTIGDAYMVAGGIPTARPGHQRDVAEMALQMRDVVAEAAHALGEPLQVRIGVHTGPVVAGVIGKRKCIYDLWGDSVNTASRMESHGLAGAIHVTDAVYAALHDRYTFEERGPIVIKGKGEMCTYLLTGRS